MNIDSAQSNFLADQTRRAFLGRAGGGFGGLALGCLLRENLASNPLKPHFAPRAKRVISLFMSGGPSHVDTFDPKPLLTKRSPENSFPERLTSRRSSVSLIYRNLGSSP